MFLLSLSALSFSKIFNTLWSSQLFLPSCSTQRYTIPEQQYCDPGGYW